MELKKYKVCPSCGAEQPSGYGRQRQQRTGGGWNDPRKRTTSLCTGEAESPSGAWNTRKNP